MWGPRCAEEVRGRRDHKYVRPLDGPISVQGMGSAQQRLKGGSTHQGPNKEAHMGQPANGFNSLDDSPAFLNEHPWG